MCMYVCVCICMYGMYCMYCVYCMDMHVCVCIVNFVCICMYLYVLHVFVCTDTTLISTYIHIHTIHAHTDICILEYTYALYVCVHMYTSNTCNITGYFQYIHICTGRITDETVTARSSWGPFRHHQTCSTKSAAKLWTACLPSRPRIASSTYRTPPSSSGMTQ
jgi:hypothetical protein